MRVVSIGAIRSLRGWAACTTNRFNFGARTEFGFQSKEQALGAVRVMARHELREERQKRERLDAALAAAREAWNRAIENLRRGFVSEYNR